MGARVGLTMASGLLAVLVVSPALQSGTSQEQITVLRTMEERYRAAKTLTATFLERYSENGRQVRLEAGKAYFLRPGKMRWDYESPEKNVFLMDGKYVWFYASADRTVTRMLAKKSEDWRAPLAFLTSGMKLGRICSSVQLTRDAMPKEMGNQVFECILRSGQDSSPKGETKAPREKVLLEVTPKNELARLDIPQEGGIEIEFSFKDWEWNPTLPEAKFRFEVPSGAAIVDGLLPETPGMRQ